MHRACPSSERLSGRLCPWLVQAVGATLLQQSARSRRPGKKTAVELEMEAMAREAEAMPKGQVGKGGKALGARPEAELQLRVPTRALRRECQNS